MNETEELLRLTLQRHAGHAPAFPGLAAAGSTRRRWTWLVPVLVAGVTAIMVVGVVWLEGRDVSQDSGPAGSTTYEGVADLTGEEVGFALGLKPISADVATGCDDAADFSHEGGFCLDGVTDDDLEMQLLKLQIMGYPRTDTLVEYAKVRLRFEDLMNSPNAPDHADQLRALVDEMDALEARMTRVTTGDESSESMPYTLRVGHCWFDPVVIDGQKWGIDRDDQFGGGDGPPRTWSGSGQLIRLDDSHYVFEDNNGLQLDLRPINDPRVFNPADAKVACH